MVAIEALKTRIGGFAKDVKLNLSSMLADETLGIQTRYGLFLAASLATRNASLIAAFEAEASERLAPPALDAAKAAASIMAMNNVYYRFLSLASNKVYRDKPARLRMNVMYGRPPFGKDFLARRRLV